MERLYLRARFKIWIRKWAKKLFGVTIPYKAVARWSLDDYCLDDERYLESAKKIRDAIDEDILKEELNDSEESKMRG